MKKRNLAILVSTVMVVSMFPFTAFSAEYTDMPSDWSTPSLEKAVNNGLINGSNGKIMAKDNLTRAQMATIINRAFAAEKEGSLEGFTDVSKNDWSYREMAKAIAMGTFKGNGNRLDPNDPITREQAFAVIARALNLRATTLATEKFSDISKISPWAKGEVYSLIKEGYVQGSNGKINPKGHITRGEFAQLMDNIIKTYISEEGVYTEDLQGNVMVKKPGVTFKDLTIRGDLIIADSVENNEVTLDNTKVTGRILARSLGKDSLLRIQQLKEILYENALEYNDEIIIADIDKAYENSMGKGMKGEFVSKSQCYSMIMAAFDLSQPVKGNNKRIGIFNLEDKKSKDNPIKELSSLGILTEDERNGDSQITKGELDRILSKIHTYIGSNKRDDFYTAVNKDWLDKDIPEGYKVFDLKDENASIKNQRIEEMILEIIKSNAEDGSIHQKIRDYYHSYVDLEKREELGIEPVKEYFDRIDAARSMQELVEVEAYINNETNVQGIIKWYTYRDEKDSRKNLIYFTGIPNMELKNRLLDEDDEFTDIYLEYLTAALDYFGGKKGDAEAIVALEKDIASYSLGTEEFWDIDKSYNPYSKAEFVDLFEGFNFEKFMKGCGFAQVESVIAHNEAAVKRLGQLMVDENLDVFKNIAKISSYDFFSGFIIGEYAEAADNFYGKLYGPGDEEDINIKAINHVKIYFSDDIEKLYIEKYFPEEGKADLMGIIADINMEFKSLLGENKWLSDQAKRKATEKVNGVAFKVGYPKEWDTALDNIVVRPDSYTENALLIFKAINNELIEMLYENPVNRDKWEYWSYFIDGRYNIDVNEIVFSSEILQGEIYDINRSREENLGSIGAMIAREIAHSFDEEGSSKDKYGRENPWWTAEDRVKFNEISKAVEMSFDGIEVMPGIFSHGSPTVKEDIADITGLKIALAVCMKDKDADLEKFFESYAKSYKTILDREAAVDDSTDTNYSLAKLRVNRVLSQIDEFYATYGIEKGHDMYIPKELRVSIW